MRTLHKHSEPSARATPPSEHTRERPPVGIGPLRLRHPVVAGLIAAVAGTAATAAGLGIGIRYLQKTGLTVETVIGLCLLVGGLALLGYAGTVGWKALRRWWRLSLLPAGLAVLVLVYSGALAVMFTVVPPTSLGPGTPADQQLAYQNVTFRTGDGVLLSAWWVPSRNGAALVVRHGSGSTRTGALDQAGVLGNHGYGLLLVDARGHGRSGGRGMDLGWYGDQDIVAAVSFLTRQPGVDPQRIGVLGLSMGGEEAIGAAAADSRIAAVVAEGATGRTADDRDEWLPGGAAGAVQRGLDAVTFGLTDLLTPASPPTALGEAAAMAGGTDFLLVTAGEVPDETSAAESIQAAARSRVEVWDVPGSSHTGGLDAAPQAWEDQVVGFFDSRLAP